jgi:hypothetical protein
MQRRSQQAKGEKVSQSNCRRLAKGWQTMARNNQALRFMEFWVFAPIELTDEM